jgi:hypothetical protein
LPKTETPQGDTPDNHENQDPAKKRPYKRIEWRKSTRDPDNIGILARKETKKHPNLEVRIRTLQIIKRKDIPDKQKQPNSSKHINAIPSPQQKQIIIYCRSLLLGCPRQEIES